MMLAIWKNREKSCYKIMFFMGLLDMACLCVCAIGAGIFGIVGVVYCTAPTLNYIMGAAGLGINLFISQENNCSKKELFSSIFML